MSFKLIPNQEVLDDCFDGERKYTINVNDAGDDTTTFLIKVLRDAGEPEALCKWRRSFEELADEKEWDAPTKLRQARLCLTGTAKSAFREACDEEVADDEDPDDAIYAAVMANFTGKMGITDETARQLRELIQRSTKPSSMGVSAFRRRVEELSSNLPYLLGPLAHSMNAGTVYETVRDCVGVWVSEFRRTNQQAQVNNTAQLVQYHSNLEADEASRRN